MRSDNLDEIATFLDVVRAGSVSAAAREVEVPKSTVSRAVKRLEARMGTELLRKAGRGPLLTEAGEAFAKLTREHIAALREVASQNLEEPDEPHGRLRLTATADFAEILLAPVIDELMGRYPRLRFEVDVTLRVVDLVGEDYDAALRIAPRGLLDTTLVAKKLAEVHVGLYASSTYLRGRPRLRTPDDLAAHDVLGFTNAFRAAPIELEGPRGGIKPSVDARLLTNDPFVLRAMLLQGASIGVLPFHVARPYVQAGRLQAVLPDYRISGAGIWLVHPPRRPLPSKLRVLRDLLIERAPKLLG